MHVYAIRGHLGSRRRSGTLSRTAAASPVQVIFARDGKEQEEHAAAGERGQRERK